MLSTILLGLLIQFAYPIHGGLINLSPVPYTSLYSQSGSSGGASSYASSSSSSLYGTPVSDAYTSLTDMNSGAFDAFNNHLNALNGGVTQFFGQNPRGYTLSTVYQSPPTTTTVINGNGGFGQFQSQGSGFQTSSIATSPPFYPPNLNSGGRTTFTTSSTNSLGNGSSIRGANFQAIGGGSVIGGGSAIGGTSAISTISGIGGGTGLGGSISNLNTGAITYISPYVGGNTLTQYHAAQTGGFGTGIANTVLRSANSSLGRVLF